ncbi:MAG: hypothetical protein ACREDM_01780 [Methylocella sp.]
MPDVIRNNWFTPQRLSVLSHRIRCKQRPNGKPIEIFDFELSSWGLDDPLPNPAEQADRLILWIGDHQPSPGEYAEISESAISAWVGVAITRPRTNFGLDWLLMQPELKAQIEFNTTQNSDLAFQLTLSGWGRYESINQAQVATRRAFMAMKFGDAELDRVVESCFKPAVDRAGFELRLLTDRQPAGLIDDQLRVVLRTSRFAIADLTHGNNGAYWEAGFAEGLGRPVIYTCRKKEWGERNDPDPNKIKVHFDTHHLATIIWDPENLQDAATRLTAMIQATLPGEAKTD